MSSQAVLAFKSNENGDVNFNLALLIPAVQGS